jgi:hypothetical protein
MLFVMLAIPKQFVIRCYGGYAGFGCHYRRNGSDFFLANTVSAGSHVAVIEAMQKQDDAERMEPDAGAASAHER